MTGTTGRGPVTPATRHHTAGAIGIAGLAAVTSGLVALALTGGLPAAVPDGLPDPGALTGWGLRLVGLLASLTAVCTVGSLLVGAVLLPARPDGRLTDLARRAVTRAGSWATAWAVLTVCQLLLTASDVAAVPLTGLDTDSLATVAASSQGRALCMVALLVTGVAATAGRAQARRGGRILLLVALAGLLPAAVTGHASSAADYDVATAALVVHVGAATLWTGGLAGLVLHLRLSPAALAAAVPRFSTLALAAYIALAGSGVLTVSTRLDASVAAWSSGYGALVIAKTAALVGLGVVGHVHRRRTLPRLSTDRGPGPFLRLAGVELVLMGTAMGLASALSRTPVPPAPVSEAVPPVHGTGHPTLPDVVRPVSLAELATAWRPNAIVLVILGLALATYLLRVRVLRRQGRVWPRARTAAFVCGLLVALVDLCSGVATYAPAMISIQVSQFLVAFLVVPALLLHGAPLALAIEAGQAAGTGATQRLLQSQAARAAANPLTGAIASSALLLAVYRTTLIGASQRSFWIHLVVLVLALVAGLLLLWPALGVNAARRPGAAGEWVWCMIAVAGCLALLAAQLRYGDRLLAAEWFLELGWGWVDPVADQRLAGTLVAAAAVGVLALALVQIRVPARGTLND